MSTVKQAIKNSFNAIGVDVMQFIPSGRFRQKFEENLASCAWQPHPRYSVFTQWDQDFYLARRDEFLHKYRCFYAISKTAAPKRIIELGTHAGSGADAYLSATPAAEFMGYDWFGEGIHQVTGEVVRPYEVAAKLLSGRGYNFRLVTTDLREIDRLPAQADFVAVDAAHDFKNEYADLKLALTADPKYIWVDDYQCEVVQAVEKFIREDMRGRVAFTLHVNYILGGGLIIKLKG